MKYECITRADWTRQEEAAAVVAVLLLLSSKRRGTAGSALQQQPRGDADDGRAGSVAAMR
jgi:hypothetical protein